MIAMQWERLNRWVCARYKAAEPHLQQGLHQAREAFVAHPRSANETYLEHLRFTATMAARFFYTSTVIVLHGLFPFLLERTATSQIEQMYRIMKTRIPQERREEIDADYTI